MPARPESSLRQAMATRRGADRTTRDAGRRATDGRKTDKDPTWTARGLVARREASRHTPTTPIETPIALLGGVDALERFAKWKSAEER
ncbi:MAG TPA: hypothetical protein VIK11_00370 [Tepidiformaceae bacterium]